MSGWTLFFLVALGLVVGILSAPRPLPVLTAVGAAILVGWLAGGWGFWGYTVAALAAWAGAVAFARRSERANRQVWAKSSG